MNENENENKDNEPYKNVMIKFYEQKQKISVSSEANAKEQNAKELFFQEFKEIKNLKTFAKIITNSEWEKIQKDCRRA